MKCRVLEKIRFKTLKGETELNPGQVAALNNDDMAIRLIIEGRITPIDNKPCKTYSKILDDYFWLVASEKEQGWLIAEGIEEVIYTKDELSKFRDEGISNEGLVAIHRVKKAFSGSVESIESTKGTPTIEDDIKINNAKSVGVEGRITSSDTAISEEAKDVSPTVEESCKCGRQATTFDFGEIEDGKYDWTFYCDRCNPRVIDCSECGSRAIPYVNSSGKHILNKCNVHGARLKVTHADIDAWSREKERNRNSNTESDDQSKRPVEVKKY